MNQFKLNEDEVKHVKSILAELTEKYDTAEDPEFLNNAVVYAHKLPERLRRFLNDFKLERLSPACVISNNPVDDNQIGQTPSHWKWKSDTERTVDLQMLFVMYASLIGDVFGWSTQQDGFIVHDILPIKGHEKEQLGSGSEELLTWHIEDAFHPYRGDYVALMCLRNPYDAITTAAYIDDLQLSCEDKDILFKPYFTIRPDESHLKKNASDVRTKTELETNAALRASYEHIEKMNTDPDKISVLFGNSEFPYMRLDPYFMDPVEDEKAQAALNNLIEAIDNNMRDIILQPGDCCFIDNYRAVHGRKPFTANYDGYDRWLKRLNITRDLRKSQKMRAKPLSRVIL